MVRQRQISWLAGCRYHTIREKEVRRVCAALSCDVQLAPPGLLKLPPHVPGGSLAGSYVITICSLQAVAQWSVLVGQPGDKGHDPQVASLQGKGLESMCHSFCCPPRNKLDSKGG